MSWVLLRRLTSTLHWVWCLRMYIVVQLAITAAQMWAFSYHTDGFNMEADEKALFTAAVVVRSLGVAMTTLITPREIDLHLLPPGERLERENWPCHVMALSVCGWAMLFMSVFIQSMIFVRVLYNGEWSTFENLTVCLGFADIYVILFSLTLAGIIELYTRLCSAIVSLPTQIPRCLATGRVCLADIYRICCAVPADHQYAPLPHPLADSPLASHYPWPMVRCSPVHASPRIHYVSSPHRTAADSAPLPPISLLAPPSPASSVGSSLPSPGPSALLLQGRVDSTVLLLPPPTADSSPTASLTASPLSAPAPTASPLSAQVPPFSAAWLPAGAPGGPQSHPAHTELRGPDPPHYGSFSSSGPHTVEPIPPTP